MLFFLLFLFFLFKNCLWTATATLHIFDSLKRVVFFDVKNVGFPFNPVSEVVDKILFSGWRADGCPWTSIWTDCQNQEGMPLYFLLELYMFFQCCERLDLLMTFCWVWKHSFLFNGAYVLPGVMGKTILYSSEKNDTHLCKYHIHICLLYMSWVMRGDFCTNIRLEVHT